MAVATTRPQPAPVGRRATNVTLSEHLVREARELRINVSRARENGLLAEVTQAKAKSWLAENQTAMEAWNDHVEQKGLPLAEYRQF